MSNLSYCAGFWYTIEKALILLNYMNINIKATNTTLTPAVKNFIQDKLSNLLSFIKEEDKIRVELEVEKKHKSGLIFRAEVDIQPRGHYAEARGNDFYEAMDLVLPKIKEQLVKQKDKKIKTRRTEARKVKKSLK